jgi:hypothetical protein
MNSLHDDFPQCAQAREEAMSDDAAKMRVGSVAFGPPNPEENTFDGMMARLIPVVLPDPQTNERRALRDEAFKKLFFNDDGQPPRLEESRVRLAGEIWLIADAMLKQRDQ